MTVSLLSGLSWKKKNPTILKKQSKSKSRGEQQQSPQHLKIETPVLKTEFFGLKMLHKNRKANSRINSVEIKLYIGFEMTVI